MQGEMWVYERDTPAPVAPTLCTSWAPSKCAPATDVAAQLVRFEHSQSCGARR